MGTCSWYDSAMDINDLNKTQLILTALLLSFVTSIATGIVTVSLMEQAPPGVTQTINRVVEKTVQVIEPQTETQVVTEQIIVREGDAISAAIASNTAHIVVLYTKAGEGARNEFASGFVVRKDGMIATTDSVADMLLSQDVYVSVEDGEYRVELVGIDREKYVALLHVADMPEGVNLPAATLLTDSGTLSLGRTVIGIDATHNTRIGTGIITRLEKSAGAIEPGDEDASNEVSFIYTSAVMENSVDGGPMITLSGDVVGVAFVSRDMLLMATPVHRIQAMLNDVDTVGVEAAASVSLQAASAISSLNTTQKEDIDTTE
jgi:S1-C subfamily serine protease